MSKMTQAEMKARNREWNLLWYIAAIALDYKYQGDTNLDDALDELDEEMKKNGDDLEELGRRRK
jgi:hypothetical protein